MRFIVDAHFPITLVDVFKECECDCIHVMSMSKKDRSTDKDIRVLADLEDRIVVTKDFDFYHSHMHIKTPKKLLLITTGNIKNRDLFNLLKSNISLILDNFNTCSLVELSNTEVIGIE